MATNYFSGLNMATYSINSGNLLEMMENVTIRAENTDADGAGVADRYTFMQAVKQAQTIEFTHFLPSSLLSAPAKASNLDISLWSIGGTSYLANLRSCDITITNKTKERSGISSAYKIPYMVGSQLEISAEHLVINSAALTDLIMTGTGSQFAVVAALTYAGEVFSAPMILKAARHEIKRGDMQMENVSLSLQGTPTGPSDTTLFGTALIGNATATVAMDTGANQYSTAVSQIALITKLGLKIKDAALIEMTGTLESQGALTVAAS